MEQPDGSRANRRIAREKVLLPLVARQGHFIDIEDHCSMKSNRYRRALDDLIGVAKEIIFNYSTNVLIHKEG